VSGEPAPGLGAQYVDLGLVAGAVLVGLVWYAVYNVR
jgi:hypothetical protein